MLVSDGSFYDGENLRNELTENGQYESNGSAPITDSGDGEGGDIITNGETENRTEQGGNLSGDGTTMQSGNENADGENMTGGDQSLDGDSAVNGTANEPGESISNGEGVSGEDGTILQGGAGGQEPAGEVSESRGEQGGECCHERDRDQNCRRRQDAAISGYQGAEKTGCRCCRIYDDHFDCF